MSAGQMRISFDGFATTSTGLGLSTLPSSSVARGRCSLRVLLPESREAHDRHAGHVGRKHGYSATLCPVEVEKNPLTAVDKS